MMDTDMESVEDFRARAQEWLSANMPRLEVDRLTDDSADDDAEWLRARELQKKLYGGGFAGIAFPKEYGGLGLTAAHQRAFTEEALEYEMPLKLNTPTFSVCAATVLDSGSEEQKAAHISAAIRGDEVMAQLLSEPKGGSDLAGVATRAEKKGDTWVLNGAKIWSSAAYAADWGLCLARTDWTVPKHQGLTMFLVPIKAEGVTVRRIRQVNGGNEFCEEFFDDVVLPADAVVGEVNDGWTVASRQLFHERNAMGGGSPYTSGRGIGGTSRLGATPVDLARMVGRDKDPAVRELVGTWHAHSIVRTALVSRVSTGMRSGALPPAAASMMRLFSAESAWLTHDVSLKVGGGFAATGLPDSDGELERATTAYLARQAGSLGGGSTEMARNMISERLLGMPREYAADKDVPFNQVALGSA